MGWLQFLADKLRPGSTASATPAAQPGPTPRDQWLLSGIYFDTTGWTLGDNSAARMSWKRKDGAELTLTREARSPGDAPPTLASLRQQHRARALAAGEGIVSVEPRSCAGAPAVEVITKFKRGMGYGFAGALELATEHDEYTVRVAAEEAFTGARESAVSSQRWVMGEITAEDFRHGQGLQPIPGWLHDPYDPAHDDSALNALSDDVRLDAVFVDHPLSRIRATLAAISASVEWPDATPSASAPPGAIGPSAGLRLLLSSTVLREIYWNAGRNDLLESDLKDELKSLDPSGTSNSAEVARLLLMLGIVQHNSNNVLYARATLERAARIFESASGAEHRDTAVALLHLGRAQKVLTRFPEARRTLERAIAILDKNHEAGGVFLSGALAAQCEVMDSLGLLREAAPLLARLVRLGSNQQPGLRSLRELAGGPPAQGQARVVVASPGKA